MFKYSLVYGFSISYFFMLAWTVSGCGDLPWPPTSCSWGLQKLCSNVRGLSKNLSDVTVASSQYDMLLCSETLVSDRVIYQSCWFLDLVVLYCCVGMECRGPVEWLHMCEMDMGHFANLNLSVAVVRCWYSGCVVLDRTSTCSVCIATLP